MTYTKRTAQIEWRPYLTADEKAALAELEAEAAVIDSRRRAITREIVLLRNRAYKRQGAATGRSKVAA
jgi:hypothetical protein